MIGSKVFLPRMTNDESNSNDEIQMTKRGGSLTRRGEKFDLEERSAKSGEAIIRFAQRVPLDAVIRFSN